MSCFGAPPSAGITYTCSSPPYWPVKAMNRPSGENLPNSSRPGFEVRREAVPPRVPTVHKSPAKLNTMRSCQTFGNRSSFVEAACAANDRNTRSAEASAAERMERMFSWASLSGSDTDRSRARARVNCRARMRSARRPVRCACPPRATRDANPRRWLPDRRCRSDPERWWPECAVSAAHHPAAGFRCAGSRDSRSSGTRFAPPTARTDPRPIS